MSLISKSKPMSTSKSSNNPVTGAKRLSLKEQLDKIIQLDDEEILLFIEEAENEEIDARGFRHAQPTTQARQDRHLLIYRKVVQALMPSLIDATEDEVDEVAFPADHKLLYKFLRVYIIQAFKLTQPRALALGKSIMYSSLAQYRQSMLFWVPRIYDEKSMDRPPKAKTFNQMVEAMRWVQNKYGTGRDTEGKKSFVGLQEIRQLFDYELSVTPCIELSEQHQAAWCIGRITCVRPSSIGPSRSRTDCLRWKDIEFTRGHVKGDFKVILYFRNLKTNNVDPEKGPAKTLDCHIKSPGAQNMVFSIAHRLLTIALRRSLLVNISTLDELFESESRYILIKSEHLEDPVFYKGGPRGLSLGKSTPLSAEALTRYLHDRGVALGYDQGITFYSIRRRAATDAVRRIGIERTRNLMGHKPDSRTLERYYLATRPTLDVTGVLLEQEIGPEGTAEDLLNEWSPLALNRLSSEGITRTQGQVLNGLTKTLIIEDPDCPERMSEAEVKLYRRRMRRRALAILLREEHEQQKISMTRKDFEERLDLSKASDFANSILRRVKDSHKNPNQDQEDDQTLELHGAKDIDFDQRFSESEIPEIDAEEEMNEESNVRECELLEDEDDHNDMINESDDVAYHEVAYQMMSLLLHNTLSQSVKWSDRDKTCPLCNEDATVSAREKNKEWRSEGHLRKHLSGSFHSKKEVWRRRQRQMHDDSKDHWLCPYCGEKSYKYAGLRQVERHLVDSKVWNTSEQHEDLKALDGWFDEDFAGYISHEFQLEKRKQFFSQRGLEEYKPNQDRELAKPKPHDTLPNTWHGYTVTWDDVLEKPYSKYLLEGDTTGHGPTSDEVIDHFGGMVSTEKTWTSEDALKRFEDIIKVPGESKTERKVKRWRRSSGLDLDA